MKEFSMYGTKIPIRFIIDDQLWEVYKTHCDSLETDDETLEDFWEDERYEIMMTLSEIHGLTYVNDGKVEAIGLSYENLLDSETGKEFRDRAIHEVQKIIPNAQCEHVSGIEKIY